MVRELAEIQRQTRRMEDAKRKRLLAIAEAIRLGFPERAIGKAAGLTGGRINQIKKGLRDG